MRRHGYNKPLGNSTGTSRTGNDRANQFRQTQSERDRERFQGTGTNGRKRELEPIQVVEFLGFPEMGAWIQGDSYLLGYVKSAVAVSPKLPSVPLRETLGTLNDILGQVMLQTLGVWKTRLFNLANPGILSKKESM